MLASTNFLRKNYMSTISLILKRQFQMGEFCKRFADSLKDAA
jgi:hypothetical protein